jgi:hypothetical protein
MDHFNVPATISGTKLSTRGGFSSHRQLQQRPEHQI